MSLKFVFPALAAGFSCASLPLRAADTFSAEAPGAILVTAPLGPKTIGEGLSSVTEIDREDIRRQQPKEFSDLLESRSGVSVKSNGGIGQQTSVFLRGHESDGTVLLVNGIRIRSATTGAPAWQFLPPQLVNRVEVVRGGRSSLYGADAMGGVVQVFTAPEGEGQHSWVEAGAGNLDTQNYNAGGSSSNYNSSVSIAGNRYRTDGAPVIEGGEDKAYDNSSGVFNASREFGNGVLVNATYLGAEGQAEYEDGAQDFVFQVAGLGLEAPITRNWRTSLQFSDARDEQTYYSEWGASNLNTRTRNSRWENWFTAGVHEFVMGAETMTDQVTGSTTYNESSRRNDAFFGQALMNFGPTELHLSLRTDDNEAFGSHRTWGVALGQRLGAGYQLRVSAGSSYKAPTFNDLYSPWGGANPDLEPEEAKSYEVGLDRNVGAWFWRASLYQSNVDNLIVSHYPEMSLNADEARLRGVEFEAGWKRSGWQVKTALSAGDFEDSNTGLPLPYRAEETVRVDVDKDFDRFSTGTTFRAEGHTYDRDGSRRIAGYGVWDLRMGALLAENLTARLTVDNVLDREHRLAAFNKGRDYITPGRTFMLSCRYEFLR